MSIYQGTLFSRRKGGRRALKKGEISRGSGPTSLAPIEQMDSSCPTPGQPLCKALRQLPSALARDPSLSRAPPLPTHRRAARLKRNFAPGEVCLSPLILTRQMDGELPITWRPPPRKCSGSCLPLGSELFSSQRSSAPQCTGGKLTPKGRLHQKKCVCLPSPRRGRWAGRHSHTRQVAPQKCSGSRRCPGPGLSPMLFHSPNAQRDGTPQKGILHRKKCV